MSDCGVAREAEIRKDARAPRGGRTLGRLRPRGSLALAVVVGLIVATAAGCGGSDTAAGGTAGASSTSVNTSTTASSGSVGTGVTPPTTSTTAGFSATSTTGASTSAPALSSAETLLPNGHIKAMGFIARVWEESGERKLEIDYAEMLTGPEADAAAVAAGVIQPGETVDNDYFIQNLNPQLRGFTVSPGVRIFTAEGGGEQEIHWDEFAAFWEGDPARGDYFQAAPWWIERDGDVVVEIRQQYLP